MQFFKFIIFLLLVFIVIFLIGLLLPSRVTILKYVEINAPAEKVMNQVVNFEEWENWYPAFKDENIAVTKKPPAKGVLSSVALKDKHRKSVNLNLLDTTGHIIDIRLKSSSSSQVNYQFVLVPKVNNQTQLTWNVNINLGWMPWKKIQGIFMDKFSGQQYQVALDNLKKAAEN
ncbi:MAG: SRPBCC family protein [Ginsengibacter sp.]